MKFKIKQLIIMLPLHGQTTTTLEYCNGKQLCLVVRQPAKPLTSQLPLCQCLWVKGTDHQKLLVPSRKRDSVVWKSVEVLRNETTLCNTSVQRCTGSQRTGSLPTGSLLMETQRANSGWPWCLLTAIQRVSSGWQGDHLKAR